MASICFVWIFGCVFVRVCVCVHMGYVDFVCVCVCLCDRVCSYVHARENLCVVCMLLFVSECICVSECASLCMCMCVY